MRHSSVRIRGLTVAQSPNPPLIVVVLAAVMGWIAADGTWLDDGARAVFYVALSIWGWEEASRGVNWFRRALGIVALAYVVFALARAFG